MVDKEGDTWDVVIIGSGPAGLGAAFHLINKRPGLSILIIEKEVSSTGGLRNDCKMNFTYPIGFPEEYWEQEEADKYLEETRKILNPPLKEKYNLSVYEKRAENLGVKLLNIKQAHLGTDGGMELIKKLNKKLTDAGVKIVLKQTVVEIDRARKKLTTDKGEIFFNHLILAPGRKGFQFLQKLMQSWKIPFLDNIVDIGIRVEAREGNYPIVKDYYDPKFIFPLKVRTFCTNSGAAHVVQEKYITEDGRTYFSINGHAWSEEKGKNGLINFALLRTVKLTKPLASGQKFAEMLGLQAALLGGGHPIMQRVGDFRLDKRSKKETFTGDLYDFEPTLKTAIPGDISLAMPAKILNSVWNALKLLDTIMPGILHPGTIIYYPEIKMYANRPRFKDRSFRVIDSIYMIGDGAGTSRGITGAWASGIRAAEGILKNIDDLSIDTSRYRS